MSKTDSLHYQLCCKGATFLHDPKKGGEIKTYYDDYLQKDCHYMQQAYKYVAVELVTGTAELPDIWGFNGWDSVLVEVKTSHSDFLADQKKWVRKEERKKYQLGNYRYYLCPDGIIKESELPDGWGLLYYDGKTIRKVIQSKYFDVYNTSELTLLASILAREVGRSKIFNYRKVEKDAPNESDLSWRDMQRIVKIAGHLCNSLEYDKIKKMGEEGYYTEILERFNKEKYGNTQE